MIKVVARVCFSRDQIGLANLCVQKSLDFGEKSM